jgi:hypothetical protein
VALYYELVEWCSEYYGDMTDKLGYKSIVDLAIENGVVKKEECCAYNE